MLRRGGIATFEGSHNKVKTLVMWALLKSEGKALSAFDIWWQVGGNYKGSLLPLLVRWTRWGYVTRTQAVDNFGELVFHYKIARKGKRFWYIASTYYGNRIREYIAELDTHYARLNEIIATGRSFSSARSFLKTYAG